MHCMLMCDKNNFDKFFFHSELLNLSTLCSLCSSGWRWKHCSSSHRWLQPWRACGAQLLVVMAPAVVAIATTTYMYGNWILSVKGLYSIQSSAYSPSCVAFFLFYRMTLCVSAIFAVARCPSVRPSVCPSVTLVDCIQTAKDIVKLFFIGPVAPWF